MFTSIGDDSPVMSAIFFLAMLAGEPVVWTPVADPDPNFVAPKTKTVRRAPAKAKVPASDEPKTLEGAFLNLEQAVEEARESAKQEEADQIERQLEEAEASIKKAQEAAAEAERQAAGSPQQ